MGAQARQLGMIEQSLFTGYDIIGDIHGCASALEQLLLKLGYRRGANGYVYDNEAMPRQAIFVGDLIDRGSQIRETLAIVKAMHDNGAARVVMGNHEFNAIAYHTLYGEDFLRPHTERSNAQIRETLEAFKRSRGALEFYLTWFRTLPLFLEFDEFRVVHACWDNQLIRDYWKTYGMNCLHPELLDVEAMMYDEALALRVLDRLTKGLSLPVPEGTLIQGRDGFMRKSFRVDFWSENAQVYDDIVFQPDPIPEEHRMRPLSEQDRNKLIFYSPDEKPLFIGHYWLSGMPALVRPNIACLDYSAVNGGKLVAYRFNTGDTGLDNRRFVYVDCGLK